MANLNLVIEVLEKELERQNLLIQSNTMVGIDEIEGPFIIKAPPSMLQLRDQLIDAIAYLKAKSPC
jgi:hypothetical protein